jgi:hypothetical protein
MVPFVNDELKQTLESMGISELQFHEVLTKPLKWENAPSLWQMHSSVSMPPILNQLRTRLGRRFAGDPVSWSGLDDANDGIHFVDGPYIPPEANYRRTQVEAMDAFYVAQMREKFGGWIGSATHPIIISQRFRKILNKLRVSDKNFVPVRLVD